MRIIFEGRRFDGPDGESVLECLERHGERAPSFCRSGVCHSCVMKVEVGRVPALSQEGLKESWRQQGYFLPCVCRPQGEIDVARCDAVRTFASEIAEVTPLSDAVLRVMLTRPKDLSYAAGQFIQLVRPSDGTLRPYSIASLPREKLIELHVGLRPDGEMSQWLRTSKGRDIEIRGPFGECVYVTNEPDRPLLLAGTGTGLAPLLGVVRAALAAGHRGTIHLLHGAARVGGLYLWDLLSQLRRSYADRVMITGSVLSLDGQPPGARTDAAPVTDRPLQDVVLDHASSSDQRVYLCGDPEFVKTLRKRIYLAGTALNRIHADPFLRPARR